MRPLARLLSVTVLLAAGCAAPRGSGVAPSTDYPPEPVTVVLLWIDGLAPAVLDQLAEDDRLPHLQRLFLREGRVFSRTIVTLPSLTYINAGGLFTGCWPARHGIYGNRWFDRRTLELRDYDSVSGFDRINPDLAVATLHEHISDQHTLSVQCHTQRGADQVRNNLITSGLAWLFGDFAAVERNAAAEAESLARQPAADWPGLAVVYFPTADATAHRDGLHSGTYAAALQRIDHQVGRVVSALEDAAGARRLHFALVTDHGQVQIPPDRRADLLAWLRTERTADIATPADGAAWRKRAALAIVGAPRRMVLHLRGAAGWQQAPTHAEVWSWITGRPGQPALWEAPGVGLVAARGAGGVILRGRSGRCRIEREADTGRVRLQAEQGTLARELAGGLTRATWHEDRDWLAATAGGDWPDLIVQMSRYFDSSRAGDVLLLAEAGWGLEPDSPAGHGGAGAAEARVRFLWRGPDVRPGHDARAIRTIDLLPTVLDLLGERPVAPLDGRSFAGYLAGEGQVDAGQRRGQIPDRQAGRQSAGGRHRETD